MTKYWLMDGRAVYSVDDALVHECCDTIEECAEGLNDYGADTCIVEVESQRVIFCRLGMSAEEATQAVINMVEAADE